MEKRYFLYIQSEKMLFLFPINMMLPFFSKGRVDFPSKKLLKDNDFGIIEKNDLHSRKNGIFSDRKIKRDKVYLVK